MFTGLVEEIGEVLAVDHRGGAAEVVIRAPRLAPQLGIGDSVTVSGACLTVTDRDAASFRADVMAETLSRTSLGGYRPGTPVNLERALTLTSRLGGHLVQGHVDATVAVLSRQEHRDGATVRWDVVRLSLPASVARYVAVKGSVALDGVSLTVSGVAEGFFEVSLIPTTLATTTLGRAAVGAELNLEVDVVAKYLERLFSDRGPHT